LEKRKEKKNTKVEDFPDNCTQEMLSVTGAISKHSITILPITYNRSEIERKSNEGPERKA